MSHAPRTYRFGGVTMSISEQMEPEEISPLFSEAWTGSMVWDAASVLVRHIERQPRDFLEDAVVVELGSGTGFVAIYAAKTGRPRAVFATDQPSLMELIRRNVAENGAAVECLPCDWELCGADGLLDRVGRALDAAGGARRVVLLCSDCLNPIYGEASAAWLGQTLVALTRLAAERGSDALTLLSQTRRGDGSFTDRFLASVVAALRCAKVHREGGAASGTDVWELRAHGSRAAGALTGSTADTSARRRDKYKVEKRMKLREFPDGASAPPLFYDKAGLPVAEGYTRVLYGDHGCYVEFSAAQCAPAAYFEPHIGGTYYDILRGRGGARLSAYLQKAPVLDRPLPPQGGHARAPGRAEGYADYRAGFYYVAARRLAVQHRDAAGAPLGPRRTHEKPDKLPLARMAALRRAVRAQLGVAVEVARVERGYRAAADRARELGMPDASRVPVATVWRGRLSGRFGGGTLRVLTLAGGEEPPACPERLRAHLLRAWRPEEHLEEAAAADNGGGGGEEGPWLGELSAALVSDVEALVGLRRDRFVLPLVPLCVNRGPWPAESGLAPEIAAAGGRRAGPRGAAEDAVVSVVVVASDRLAAAPRSLVFCSAGGLCFEAPSDRVLRATRAALARWDEEIAAHRGM